MTLLDATVAHLQRHDVSHALIGAAALALHGISRSTLDQDLLVTDRRVLDPAFWTTLGSTARIDARRGDADDPLAGVVRLSQESERDVDIVVGRSRWQGEVLARAVTVPSDLQLRLVTRSDLVLLKLYAGGNQDAWDIEQLFAAPGVDTAAAEVEARLSDLPPRCTELWRRLRRR